MLPEEIAMHKPFRVIADYLTRTGIVVLRYDDRGVGGSSGEFITGSESMVEVQSVIRQPGCPYESQVPCSGPLW